MKSFWKRLAKALPAVATVLFMGPLFTACEHSSTRGSRPDTNITTLTAKNFQQEVLGSSQPVLVDFWAEWCAPCKILAPTISELATEYLGKVKVGKVNVDLEGSLVEKYNVEGFPTVLIFKDGKIVDRTLGVADKKEFQAKLGRALAAVP